jgi:protocatechuate 3,4-dioxygenase, alpha subunit
VTTPSQTVGPFFAFALPFADGEWAAASDVPGAVRIHGTVVDGEGVPVPDALIETWQASPDGRFDHPDDPRGAAGPALAGFRGFGRATTETGGYRIRTVKPGPLPTADGEREAPHLDVSVFARGLLDRVVTRIYFPDEDNAADPVLRDLPPDRAATLVARPATDGYEFDIVLRGPDETVFFDV